MFEYKKLRLTVWLLAFLALVFSGCATSRATIDSSIVNQNDLNSKIALMVTFLLDFTDERQAEGNDILEIRHIRYILNTEMVEKVRYKSECIAALESNGFSFSYITDEDQEAYVPAGSLVYYKEIGERSIFALIAEVKQRGYPTTAIEISMY